MADPKTSDKPESPTASNSSEPSKAAAGAKAGPKAGSKTAGVPVANVGLSGPPKPKRKRKVAAVEGPKKIPLLVRALTKFREFLALHGLPLINELFSPDVATRRMTSYFLITLAGFTILLGAVAYTCGSSKIHKMMAASQEIDREKREIFNRQRESADLKASWFSLEKFSFDLKSNSEDRLRTERPWMVEFDLSIQADSPETRIYLEENLVQARNIIFRSLVGWDRETLMTPEGKKKLRQTISDSLNIWLPEGKVVDLYFVHFLFKR